jgi:hypothetical protein
MFKITDDNYDEYKEIYNILWKIHANIMKMDPDIEISPINVLNNWEEKSKSLAKKGLKEGLRDLLSMSMDFSENQKILISNQLINQGFPSFDQLIAIVKNTPQKVLKRGNIKGLDEYYIIKEVLCSPRLDITELELRQLAKIFDDFEANYVKG